MKLFLTLAVLLTFSACKEDEMTLLLHKMEGVWLVKNMKGELQFKESWKQTENGLVGKGEESKNDSLVLMEELEIFQQGGNWIYNVGMVHEESMPFVFENFTQHGFKAVNMTNDFPQSIIYIVENKEMEVILSNQEDTVRMFFFKEQVNTN